MVPCRQSEFLTNRCSALRRGLSRSWTRRTQPLRRRWMPPNAIVRHTPQRPLAPFHEAAIMLRGHRTRPSESPSWMSSMSGAVSASGRDVYPALRERMKRYMTPGDFDRVSAGDDRWRSTVKSAREDLVQEGYLRDDSPRRGSGRCPMRASRWWRVVEWRPRGASSTTCSHFPTWAKIPTSISHARARGR